MAPPGCDPAAPHASLIMVHVLPRVVEILSPREYVADFPVPSHKGMDGKKAYVSLSDSRDGRSPARRPRPQRHPETVLQTAHGDDIGPTVSPQQVRDDLPVNPTAQPQLPQTQVLPLHLALQGARDGLDDFGLRLSGQRRVGPQVRIWGKVPRGGTAVPATGHRDAFLQVDVHYVEKSGYLISRYSWHVVLETEMSHAILRYRPKDAPPEWEAVADGVRMLVATVADHVPYPLTTVLRVVAMLAVNAERAGVSRDPAVWLEQSTITRYVLTDTGLAGGTSQTYAALLSRVREALVWVERGEPARPHLRADRSGAEPYSTSDLTRLDVWSGNLPPTPTGRGNARAMLALGAGCGLFPSEMLAVRGTDVHVLPSDAVVVRVPGTNRLVVCRSLWEQALAELARRAGNRYLYAPDRQVERPKNAISNWVARNKPGDRKVPVPDMRRLRATWIVSLLRDHVPTDLIAKAAGLKSAAALAPYLAWVPEISDDAAVRLLRGWA